MKVSTTRDNANKTVGTSVYNKQNERIGSIQQVPFDNDDDSSDVVLALGGFRGISGKLVEVPYRLIDVANDKLVIAGATKDQLMQLPSYRRRSSS